MYVLKFPYVLSSRTQFPTDRDLGEPTHTLVTASTSSAFYILVLDQRKCNPLREEKTETGRPRPLWQKCRVLLTDFSKWIMQSYVLILGLCTPLL